MRNRPISCGGGAALTALGTVFGVLLVVYEQLGWPRAHALAGGVIAALVLAGATGLAKRSRSTLPPRATNAVVVAGVVGFLALPVSMHVVLDLAGRPDPVAWPHGGLLEVPRLANDEPVRGTGCGAHTETTRVTPTTIPDGTWFGAIQSVDDDTPSLAFDLICAYESEAQARKNPSYATLAADAEIARYPRTRPTWLTVNANSRVRTVPIATNFRYREGQWSASGECTDRSGRDQPLVTGVHVWLVIVDDQAVLAVRLCDLERAPAS